jgi:hypothetical protein
MQRIEFSDFTLEKIAKDTGLSKLELMGVIAAMNKHTLSAEQIRRNEQQRDRDGY